MQHRLAVYPHQSMIDWASSFQTEAPILLYDADRELTPQQAAEQMLYEFGKQLTKPAIDRYFYYENYSGWDFELYIYIFQIKQANDLRVFYNLQVIYLDHLQLLMG